MYIIFGGQLPKLDPGVRHSPQYMCWVFPALLGRGRPRIASVHTLTRSGVSLEAA